MYVGIYVKRSMRVSRLKKFLTNNNFFAEIITMVVCNFIDSVDLGQIATYCSHC